MVDKFSLEKADLKHANVLLRSGEWDRALRSYQALWQSSPHLRALVAGNIGYVLRNAPAAGLDRALRNAALRLIEGFDPSIPVGGGSDLQATALHEQATERQDPVPKPHRPSQGPCMSMVDTSPLRRSLELSLGIERIYVVNLGRRPDRYVRVLREMTRHGLVVERIEAVDAKVSEEARRAHEDFRRRPVGERRPSSRHVDDDVMNRYKLQLPAGVFGYILSQGLVIRDAMRQGYKRILVLDDDVFFCSDAIERLNALGPRLPRNLKVLLLGASEYADRQSERFESARLAGHGDLYRPLPGETCGSFAMVYDRAVFGDLLEVIEEADGTFDNVALGAIYRRYPDDCLVVDPAICIPDVGDSDIRPNSRMQAIHSERMRWEFTRYGDYTAAFHITVLVDDLRSLRHVQSLQHEMPSEMFLNIFYLSEDGLRPVITGHCLRSKNRASLSIGATNGVRLRALVDKLRVPRSSIVISWPEYAVLTEDAVNAVVARAMELRNKTGLLEGERGGISYCLDAGVMPVSGRHSIIIPAFRSVEHVWPTVRSALDQDAQDVEIVVVNDNPENGSFSTELRAKVESWSRSVGENRLVHRMLILDHKINRNASAARNTGLLRSTGEFVSFLDDDDFFEPQRLSAIEDTLAGAPSNVGGCYCGYTGAWNGERDIDRFCEGDLGDRVLTLRYSEHYMCTNTVSFLRSSMQKLGGFNESYDRHQDLELMTRFFEQFTISAVREFLVRNRPTPVPETFVADIPKLCRLKHLFLSDMRLQVLGRGAAFAEEVIDAHTKDITKRDKHMSADMVVAIRTFLSSALMIN